MEASTSRLSLHVQLQGQLIKLDLPTDPTHADIFESVASRSSFPVTHLKILYKGKAVPRTETAITDIPNGSKLFAIGSEPDAVKAGEDVLAEQKRRDFIRATRATAVPRTTHSTAVGTLDTLDSARFHQINPFPEGVATPFMAKRREMLQKLATDAAILEIMKKQDFRVGELTELHPHRDPTLLGINRNAGQSIGLRLLTDRLDGLRAYNSVRRVLIHELTHNKFGPHDNDFLALDSKLAKEVAAHEQASRSAGNRLGGDLGEVFDPETRREAASMAHGDGCTVEASESHGLLAGQRLGGESESASAGGSLASDARAQAARAAERRRQHPYP